jgi:hypothetical protein
VTGGRPEPDEFFSMGNAAYLKKRETFKELNSSISFFRINLKSEPISLTLHVEIHKPLMLLQSLGINKQIHFFQTQGQGQRVGTATDYGMEH